MKARIASLLLRMIAATWLVRIRGQLPMGRCVVAFWHGEMLPIWYVFRVLRPTALVSASKDGNLLACLLLGWRYRVVRGSSSKGGSEALAELVDHAAKSVVLITPDGPRGPALVAKPGAVVAAHRANVPVYAVRMNASHRYRFVKSWDTFMLPLPFSRVVVEISAPIVPDAHASREEIDAKVRQLTAMLNSMDVVL